MMPRGKVRKKTATTTATKLNLILIDVQFFLYNFRGINHYHGQNDQSAALRSKKMLCASERIKLPKEEPSRIEMLEKRQAKCRPRAWLSRLMSWRTLTSNNTQIHTDTHTFTHML